MRPITCAATTFMIPLGLAQAVSVRIGQARGASEKRRYLPIVFGTLGMTVLIMAVFAVVFMSARAAIAASFVANSAIAALAAQLLLIAGFFQIFDGIQIASTGALRGPEGDVPDEHSNPDRDLDQGPRDEEAR